MSKTLPLKLIFSFVAFVFVACNQQPDCMGCYTCGENAIYGPGNVDTTDLEFVPESAMDTSISVDENFTENKKKIEEKYGEQWDFCHCIFANDSLDKVVKSGGDLDDDFFKAFETVDQKCKAFLVMSPNQTPSERAAHEKKVKDCLRGSRL